MGTVFLRESDKRARNGFDLFSGRMNWCEGGKIHVLF